MTYHCNENCRAAQKISNENKQIAYTTETELKKAGYKPCGICSK